MPKMKKYASVNEYLADFEEPVQAKIRQMIKIIEEQASDAKQTFAYGIPTYKFNGKTVVHFAAYQGHIGLYPGPAAVAKFKRELEDFSTSRGAIQFPLDRPLPTTLIRKIVKFARDNNTK